MITTTKLGLKLPQDDDLVEQQDYNGNFERLEGYVTTLTQACSATTPAPLSLTTKLQTVRFGAKVQTGYAFALSGGGIKLLEPGFVKTSIHVYVEAIQAGDALGIDIAKNGSTYWQYSAVESDSNFVHVDLTSRLTPVAKNDIITMQVRNLDRNGGSIVPVHTYMTVDLYKDLN